MYIVIEIPIWLQYQIKLLYLIYLAFQAQKIPTFYFKNNWLISAINFHDTVLVDICMYVYVSKNSS